MRRRANSPAAVQVRFIDEAARTTKAFECDKPTAAARLQGLAHFGGKKHGMARTMANIIARKITADPTCLGAELVG